MAVVVVDVLVAYRYMYAIRGASVRNLTFSGSVKASSVVEMTIPCRDALTSCPADWPLTLEPGTLNINILRYPPEVDNDV
jgi:hypothetical protein